MASLKNYYSHGKLLLTGEYVVLDGATALSFPTKLGQTLEVNHSKEEGIFWKSFDNEGNLWFFETFYADEKIFSTNQDETSSILLNILNEAKKLNPEFLKSNPKLNVITRLEFSREWGLGSSSTLINNIAQWADVNAFQLLENSFGGSGYDIAAAQQPTSILYKRNGTHPQIEKTNIDWPFKKNLFFIHLNKKQSSKKAIKNYKNKWVDIGLINEISKISKAIVSVNNLSDFEKLLNLHEQIISKILNTPTIKQLLFKDYPYTIKSLGAWGGDFILASGTPPDLYYFKEKGYNTIVPFQEMVL